MTITSTDLLVEHADRIRGNALEIAARRGQGYIGQALGTADLLSVLFFHAMNLDGPPERRDRFVLSPGHYALALYAVMAELGVYEFDELRSYGMDGSRIEESPMEGTPGFEVTGGSLAQGLSQAVGMALARRIVGRDGAIFCLISDGELEEGQTWEALLSAAHLGLENLTILLDRNRRQVDGSTEEVSTLEPVQAKFEAFGLPVQSVDGHDVGELTRALDRAGEQRDGPVVVICETTLGRGVAAFESASYPHYVRLGPKRWQEVCAESGLSRDDQIPSSRRN
jgi:transketolase